MGLRLPNLDYYTMLGGIGDNIVNAYDRYQAPKLIADAMAMQVGGAAQPTQAAMPTPATAPIPMPTTSTPQPMAQDGNSNTQSPNIGAGFTSLFDRASKAFGLSPDYLKKTAFIESRGNPSASNPSGAQGLFQFMPATAQQYGLSNPNDPAAATVAAARLAADNKASLQKALGRDPTDAELYLAHQQGAGGAAQLLANPNAPAASIVGQQAVVQNGGSPDMSAGQFANLWINKYNSLEGNGGAVPPPNQVADASGIVVPPSVGASRGVNYSPQMIQRLMQNPYTKSVGTALMQAQIANMSGKPDFKQFGNTIYRQGPDGSLTPVGNIPKDPQLVDVPNGEGGTQKMWLRPGQSSGPAVGGIDTGKDTSGVQNFKYLQENAADLGLPDPKSGDPAAKQFWGNLSQKMLASGGVNVSVNTSAETKQAQELGGAKGEVFSNYIKSYDGAHEKMQALNAMQNFINSNPDMYMGAGADSVLAAKKFAKGIGEALKVPGLDNINVSSQEGIDKFGRQLAGAAAKTVGGARVTNFELEQFIKANPGLLTTREGNARLINIMQQMAQREMDMSNLAADYTDKNPGASLSGFRGEVKKYDAANPIKDMDGTVLSGAAVKPAQGMAASQGQTQARQPLPQGYSAARAVNEARQALQTPGLSDAQKQAIRDRLKSYGIDPANAGQ